MQKVVLWVFSLVFLVGLPHSTLSAKKEKPGKIQELKNKAADKAKELGEKAKAKVKKKYNKTKEKLEKKIKS